MKTGSWLKKYCLALLAAALLSLPLLAAGCNTADEIQRKEASSVELVFKAVAYDKGIEILIECLPEIIKKSGDVHLNILGPLSGGGTKKGVVSRRG